MSPTPTEPPSTSAPKPGQKQHGAHLSAQAISRAWATPTTKEGDSIGPREMEVLRTGEDAGTTFESRLKLQAQTWTSPSTSSLPDLMTPKDGDDTSSDTRVLNPLFVEALMAFPRGWTDCERSETPSSARRRKSLSVFLLSVTAAMPSPGTPAFESAGRAK